MVKIINGDCLEELRKMEGESVQCCVTSPPYWGLRDYGCEGQLGLEKTPQEYVGKMVEVFRQVRRVLKKDGTLWLNLGDSYWTDSPVRTFNAKWDQAQIASRGGLRKTAAKNGVLKNKDLCMMPARVAIALQADGWWLRSDIIWSKANCMPESVRDRPTRSHEYIFLMTKSARYCYDAEAIKEPASEADWESRIGRANLNNKLLPTEELNGIRTRVKYTPNNKVNYDRGDLGRSNVGSTTGMRNKRDVWTVAPANFPEAHFATFPTDLIKPCILAGSRIGDTVLDPFGGTQPTGMVAEELGRDSVLIDLNPKYCHLAEKRCLVTPGMI